MLKIQNTVGIIAFTLVISLVSGLYDKIITTSYSNIFTITINTKMTVNHDVSTTMEYNEIHLPVIKTSTGLFSSL